MKRRLGNILVLCAAIVVLYGMQQSKPHYMDLTGPIPVPGKMHDKVRTRQFDVIVDNVVFARELTFERFGTTKVMTTSGVWVVVTVALGATSASNSVARATWVGPTGLQYDSSDRTGYLPGLPPHSLEPGLPKMARFVFETLPDQVSGATLVLSNQLFPRLDSQAHIAIDDFKKFNDGQPLVLDSFDMNKPITVTEKAG
ncbi:hypothetical protein CU102_17560 [Phyllobacterium brassicacearum]|uniref:Uncharacterized protein n=1 Tax=Phyllobacterium brassicacearum TaxID=314235 RepID=A0A2P7BMK3_9HYPH|nr:hypothetical protein [Phyllobacterium brassicacearum]PSH67693.1 hypothetical protein CU102_17560 [Phyllobacterium brassicacearum]TDQ25933.1 hypothetical protein DEV91_113110 [Phyllobacterium brassicacearum]